MASQVFIKKSRILIILILACILAAIVFSVVQQNEFKSNYLNHNPEVAYVGMEACEQCHSDKHSSFIHTGMGQSFDVASRDKSKADFSQDHVIFDSTNGMNYRPFWQGADLYIEEFRLENGDTVHSLNQKIDYIIGSGQHTNSHLFQVNDFLYQAPLTYYVQEGKWDLPPGYENGNNTRFSRILNEECISCHNAMPVLEVGTDNQFLQIGKGIDCERCHGPGELHVKERKKGDVLDGAVDYTIVNPRDLSWERQIDVCQRCHLQGLNVLQENKSFTDFRPGMVLSDVFEIYLPQTEGSEAQFDMANHSARLQKSACFIKSNNSTLSFTCITCHNPHISVEQTGRAVYNSACKNCHQQNKCTEQETELAKHNYNCVACHMPQKGTDDIPHVSVHDHFIRVPEEREVKSSSAKLIGLYAVNSPNPTPFTLTKAYLEYWEKFDKNPFFLNKAKVLLEKYDFDELWIKYYYLKELYDEVLQVGFDESTKDARTWFMVGFAHQKKNQNSLAKYYLKKASERAKTDVQIRAYYLKTLVDNGYLEEAIVEGQQLEKLFPLHGEVQREMAKAYLLKGDLAKGLGYANRALDLMPDDLGVWEVIMNAYLKTNDVASAQKWAQKILAVNPNHAARQLLQSD